MNISFVTTNKKGQGLSVSSVCIGKGHRAIMWQKKKCRTRKPFYCVAYMNDVWMAHNKVSNCGKGGGVLGMRQMNNIWNM